MGNTAPTDRVPTDRLPIADAAAQVPCSVQHLYNLRGAGLGPATYKVAGRLFVDQRDLDVWIARQRAASLVAG